jgi:hypothetical protein
MTHHTINYSALRGNEASRKAKALRDIKEWLGAKRYAKITAEFRAMKQPSRAGFHLQVSFAGVSGYPVHVWYEELWNPTQHDMHVWQWFHG